MTPSKIENLSQAEMINQMVDTYSQVFQVVDIPADKAAELAKGFIHETIKRSAIHLCEIPDSPHSEATFQFLETSPDSYQLMDFLADKYEELQLSRSFTQSYVEIFAPWFEAVSSDLSTEKKLQIQTLLKNYQDQFTS